MLIKKKITFPRLNSSIFNQDQKWVVQKGSDIKIFSTRAEALCSALGGNRTPLTESKANRIIPV